MSTPRRGASRLCKMWSVADASRFEETLGYTLSRAAEVGLAMEEPLQMAEAVRQACIAAALQAYEDTGLSGLCQEGRWEYAVDAMYPPRMMTPGQRMNALLGGSQWAGAKEL